MFNKDLLNAKCGFESTFANNKGGQDAESGFKNL